MNIADDRVWGGHKEGIYSPITQNERHMEVLKECKAEDKNIIKGAAVRSLFEFSHKSLVVLANPKTVVNDRYANFRLLPEKCQSYNRGLAKFRS